MGNCACLTRRQLSSSGSSRTTKSRGGGHSFDEAGNETESNTANAAQRGRRSPSLNNFSSQSSCHSNSNPNLNREQSSSAYWNNLIMNNDLSEYMPPTGKNRRLKKDFFKYFKIDKKINEKQLQAKRDEFWDTAPVFDGKPEIWTALKAAVDACEAQNFQLAQAIIDSANIILPNGLLNDCYDELGNRYQLPIYVIAKPIQIGSRSGGGGGDSKCDKDSLSGADESSAQTKSDKSSKKKNEKRSGGLRFKSKSKKSSRKSDKKCSGVGGVGDELEEENQAPDAVAHEEASFTIKLRLSTHSDENDFKLDVQPSLRVLELKNRVKEAFNVEPAHQKMFFGGKQLHDKDRLRAYKFKENIVVQVIVSQSAQAEQ